jgi:hypothetical protein
VVLVLARRVTGRESLMMLVVVVVVEEEEVRGNE